jgi:hypothetical protein
MPTEMAATWSMMGRLLELAAGEQGIDGVLRRHKGAGDAGGAGAAVSLDHVAVKVDGALAEFLQVKHRAHRAADEALDFLRAAALLAAGGFAVAAGVRGAGQHAVFGGDPAFAAAFFMAGHFFFDGGGAQHLGAAELDQHRAFGVGGVVAGDAHAAQGVGCTRAASFKLTHGWMAFWQNAGQWDKADEEDRKAKRKRSAEGACHRGKPGYQAFLAAERRMASLISAMDRSMVASSRSSTMVSSTPAWMVEANTPSMMLSVDTPRVDSKASGFPTPWPAR